MNQTIYVSSPENQQIFVWKLNNSQPRLELIQVIYTPGDAQPIAIHPNRQFLYAGVRPNFGIVTYSIDQTGLLHEIHTKKISYSPTYLTVNSEGTFLYCVSYRSNTITVLAINTLGTLNKSVQTITNLLGCHSANIDINKQLLWVPCLLENTIKFFNIDKSAGILTPYDPHQIITKIKSGPRHMVFHKTHNHAYVINELNGTIYVIEYDLKKSQQTIKIIQTIHILPKNNNTQNFWSADIHITPNNQWLYCTDRLFNTISCFEITSNNKKLKFKHYQYTEKQPRGFAIDTTGQFLIVAGQKSNHISLYLIQEKNGKLILISRYLSGIGPTWVQVISHTIQKQ